MGTSALATQKIYMNFLLLLLQTPQRILNDWFFYVLLPVDLDILCNENQTDALFIFNLLRQSTLACFGHMYCPLSGGIQYIRRAIGTCYTFRSGRLAASQLECITRTNCCTYTVNTSWWLVNFLIVLMFNCWIVMYVPLFVRCVLFVCKCALYYCHRVSTQLQ
jgi:hypothetical protein